MDELQSGLGFPLLPLYWFAVAMSTHDDKRKPVGIGRCMVYLGKVCALGPRSHTLVIRYLNLYTLDMTSLQNLIQIS